MGFLARLGDGKWNSALHTPRTISLHGSYQTVHLERLQQQAQGAKHSLNPKA